MSYEFWLVVGSQTLYGPEVLATVERNSREMAAALSEVLPFPLVYKTTVKSAEEAQNVVRTANYEASCAGVITWCHTFSPSKMWLQALQELQKPWCHFATQYHDEIPADEIDMDFMNLNQAAHGDREHGFIGTRLGRKRKIVVGHWKEPQAQEELANWMRSAIGVAFSRSLRVLRFGDNMRDVAVTEGDKIEALKKFGWSVDYWPVGYLTERMGQITEEEIDAKMAEYQTRYAMATGDVASVRYQAKIEVALRSILCEQNAQAVVTNFQDLYGLDQLPGLAVQNLMADGYGFGAEGDWKTAALTAVVKKMGEGLQGGCSFIEDYSYHYSKKGASELAAHMLEVCPTISSEKAKIEVHPLGIGDRQPPARLVFEADPGAGVAVTVLDMGGRMRMIAQKVTCVKCLDMPKLPVARVMWVPEPDLRTALQCWIMAGGGHHSVLTKQISCQVLEDWAQAMDIEFIRLDRDTTPKALDLQLMSTELYWKLR